MTIGAKEASKLVGKSKQTIVNAITSGKISAVKGLDGSYQIEPVELFRVFAPLSNMGANGNGKLDDAMHPLDTPLTPSVDALAMLERVIEAKDALIATQDEVIADLRRRLDASTAQVEQMAAVLAQLQPPKAKVGWWQRLLGNGAYFIKLT